MPRNPRQSPAKAKGGRASCPVRSNQIPVAGFRRFPCKRRLRGSDSAAPRSCRARRARTAACRRARCWSPWAGWACRSSSRPGASGTPNVSRRVRACHPQPGGRPAHRGGEDRGQRGLITDLALDDNEQGSHRIGRHRVAGEVAHALEICRDLPVLILSRIADVPPINAPEDPR